MKKLIKNSTCVICLIILVCSMGLTAFAESDEESIEVETTSFSEGGDYWDNINDFDEYVDGIYNVGENVRTNMVGVIRLCKSGSKLVSMYSTSYTHSVDKIGLKNIKLQYKGSLGIWHDIITLDNRYWTNESAYQGSFSCSGVIGRVYRMKGTHYIIDGSYTETRNNVTENFTF